MTRRRAFRLRAVTFVYLHTVAPDVSLNDRSNIDPQH